MKNEKLRSSIKLFMDTSTGIFAFPAGVLFWFINEKSFIDSIFCEDAELNIFKIILSFGFYTIVLMILSMIVGGY